ncbi:MAG: enoyl-CoA hydratase-related protein [Sphingomonas sp.]|jgi:enoyl-CoA hydratase/carnithine racemase|uniref:enoyl-CoA hydratase-related protein n=1 Tax=Sphingomonas sp. TaxID=28214 RepID=UPI003568C0B4
MTELHAQSTWPETDGLSIALSNQVLTIRLDHPDKRNAITYDMYSAITERLRAAAEDPGVRCVVIAATGAIFTGGHDISGFARGLDLAPEEKPSFAFMQTLARFPKPVIAAVNGDAVGIGATMLLHCDLVYAVPEARIVFPFVDMGLVPEFAATHWLPRMIGHRRAMALFLCEGRCSAQRALEWGIVNETHPADQLAGHVSRAAARIAGLSPEAVRQTKRLLRKADADAVDAAITEEAQILHDLLGSDIAREKLAAIRQRISKG